MVEGHTRSRSKPQAKRRERFWHSVAVKLFRVA
jgi:hypothetical protein